MTIDPTKTREALARVESHAEALLKLAAELSEREGPPVAPVQARTLMRSARDVGHHAPQLIGYVDGFESRARARAWLDEALAGFDVERATPRRLGELYMVAARALMEAARDLRQREVLELAAEGPRKPGIRHTCAWTLEHLGTVHELLLRSVEATRGGGAG